MASQEVESFQFVYDSLERQDAMGDGTHLMDALCCAWEDDCMDTGMGLIEFAQYAASACVGLELGLDANEVHPQCKGGYVANEFFNFGYFSGREDGYLLCGEQLSGLIVELVRSKEPRELSAAAVNFWRDADYDLPEELEAVLREVVSMAPSGVEWLKKADEEDALLDARGA